jgi:hypothetical protein
MSCLGRQNIVSQTGHPIASIFEDWLPLNSSWYALVQFEEIDGRLQPEPATKLRLVKA